MPYLAIHYSCVVQTTLLYMILCDHIIIFKIINITLTNKIEAKRGIFEIPNPC